MRSSSATVRPRPASKRFQSPSFFAQATWFEPGPWHASQRDVQVGPRRVERPGLLVVALAQVGGVTVGALVVPVLVDTGPVLRVARLEIAIGIEMEPALAARRFRPRVPRDPQRLQPPAGELDQVLLQRIEAEGVPDFEVGELPIRAVGVDEVLAVALEERRGDAGKAELRAAEIRRVRSFRSPLPSRGRDAIRATPRSLSRGTTRTPEHRRRSRQEASARQAPSRSRSPSEAGSCGPRTRRRRRSRQPQRPRHRARAGDPVGRTSALLAARAVAPQDRAFALSPCGVNRASCSRERKATRREITAARRIAPGQCDAAALRTSA